MLTASRVVVVEIDDRTGRSSSASATSGANPHVEVVNEDILKFNLGSLTSPEPFKIVGNLPYNLTSPILRESSRTWDNWSDAIVMVQKEVGDRLCAKVGGDDYGALTAGMNLTCTAERVFDLGRKSARSASEESNPASIRIVAAASAALRRRGPRPARHSGRVQQQPEDH